MSFSVILFCPREHKQSHNCNPSFRLKSIGEDAKLSRTKEERIPLYLSDLQALLTFCLAGDDAPCLPHRLILDSLILLCISITGAVESKDVQKVIYNILLDFRI